MKIVYLSKSVFPSFAANSIHIYKMCQAIEKLGHDILLFGKKPDDQIAEPTSKQLGDFYGEVPRFKIQFEPSNDRSGLFKRILSVFAAKKKWSGALFYGRDIEACLWFAAVGCTTVLELHSMPHLKGYKRLMFKYLLSNKKFKKIVVISEILKNDLINEYRLSTDYVLVAHDGADDIDGINALIKPKKDKFSVSYIGHLYPGKGMEILAELIPLMPEIHFDIVGGNEGDVKNWREKLNGFTNCTFYGMVSPKETILYKLNADVLIAPYSKQVYGVGGKNITAWMSPLKLFEYMAAGRPIVTSDLPVIREVLQHNHNALLSKPDEIDHWVSNIRKLYADPKLCESLAKTARHEFLTHHTWKKRADKIIKSLA